MSASNFAATRKQIVVMCEDVISCELEQLSARRTMPRDFVIDAREHSGSIQAEVCRITATTPTSSFAVNSHVRVRTATRSAARSEGMPAEATVFHRGVTSYAYVHS